MRKGEGREEEKETKEVLCCRPSRSRIKTPTRNQPMYHVGHGALFCAEIALCGGSLVCVVSFLSRIC